MGVFTQEGWDMFMHTCAWNTMYILLKLFLLALRTPQVAEAFSTSFFLYFMIFSDFVYRCTVPVFLIVYHSSSTHSCGLTSQISLTLWLVLTFPASSSSFVLLTCLQRQNRCAHYHCNLQADQLEFGHFIKALESGFGDKQDYQPGTVLSSWESEITGHCGPSLGQIWS